MKRSIPRIRSSAKNQRQEEEEEEVIGFSVLLSAGNGRCQNGKKDKKYLRNDDEFLPSSLCTVRRLLLSFSPLNDQCPIFYGNGGGGGGGAKIFFYQRICVESDRFQSFE